MNIKGGLPLLILHNLQQGSKHGYQIAKEIRQRSGGVLDFAEGTLYPALHGLEKQGLIASFEADENGRTRRYYRLTEAGAAALAKEHDDWQRYTAAVNLVLGGAK